MPSEAELVELPPTPDQMLVLVTSGDAIVESYDGGRWRSARYVPGQIGMTAPGRSTRLRWHSPSGEPLRTLHIHLPGGLIGRTARELWGRDAAPAMPDSLAVTDEVMRSVLLGLANAARAGADDLYAESAAVFLAAHALVNHGGAPAPEDLPRPDARIRRTVEYMNDNLHLPLSLADLARTAELSPYRFLRVFKEAEGETPRRYLNGLRIARARRHLERGELPVTEIAYLCGFSSSAHLAAAFRRETGLSPTAYRAEHKRNRAPQ